MAETYMIPPKYYREVYKQTDTTQKTDDTNMLTRFMWEEKNNIEQRLLDTRGALYKEENGSAYVMGNKLSQKPSYNTCMFVRDFYDRLGFNVAGYCEEPSNRWLKIDVKDSTWNKHKARCGTYTAHM